MATGVLNPLWAGVASPSPHHFHICPLGSRTKPVGSLQEGTPPALGSLQRVKVTVTGHRTEDLGLGRSLAQEEYLVSFFPQASQAVF